MRIDWLDFDTAYRELFDYKAKRRRRLLLLEREEVLRAAIEGGAIRYDAQPGGGQSEELYMDALIEVTTEIDDLTRELRKTSREIGETFRGDIAAAPGLAAWLFTPREKKMPDVSFSVAVTGCEPKVAAIQSRTEWMARRVWRATRARISGV